MAPLPHEMLHKFGFGHDDFMDIWASAVRRRLRESPVPSLAPPPKPPLQRTILAFLRGETSSDAPKALTWVIFGRYGLEPFRGYQKVEKIWKPVLQANGLNDDETYCAILSEMAGEDLRGLYAAAGLAIRPQVYAVAKEKIAALKAGQDPKTLAASSPAGPAPAQASAPPTAGASGKTTASTDPAAAVNRAVDNAMKKGGGEGLAILRRALPQVRNLSLNRARVRTYMRFGKAFDDLGDNESAYAAYRDAQREAAKVSRAYLDLCRRISLDALMGKPLMLGHM